MGASEDRAWASSPDLRPNRFVREHFTVFGEPKQPFDTKEMAQEAAHLYHQWCYQCKFCGKWHLTHTKVKGPATTPKYRSLCPECEQAALVATPTLVYCPEGCGYYQSR